VQIMRQAWTEGTATFSGKHYQVDGAIVRPLPLQEGGVPLWIAGGGEKKTLRIAAQYANYTNFDGLPEAFRHKSAILQSHCADLGTDFGSITRSANYAVVIGETEKDVRDRLAWARAHFEPYLPADRLDDFVSSRLADGLLVGTPEQIAEKLTAMEQLGMTYAICYFPEAAYDASGYALFAERVIPALAGA
jgi:alkanesulfonate monooxygenase SsuD/methylene tetrahydromethanopterin reductase-like flavin-dependent oxidoreductase (luciferase family)